MQNILADEISLTSKRLTLSLEHKCSVATAKPVRSVCQGGRWNFRDRSEKVNILHF